MKKRNLTRLLAGALSAALLLSGCSRVSEDAPEGDAHNQAKGEPAEKDDGNSASGEKVMGRYVGEELAEVSGRAFGLTKTEEGLQIHSLLPGDYLIRNGSSQAELLDSSSYPEAYREFLNTKPYLLDVAVAPGGARIFSVFESEDAENYRYLKYLLLPDGSLREWNEAVDENVRCSFWYGEDGYFYAEAFTDTPKLYRISAETGETEFMADVPEGIVNLYGNGACLFLNNGTGISIFDTASKTFLEEDTVLSEFLSGELETGNGNNTSNFLIASGENEETIYVATQKGIFRHVLYGNIMEQMLDGSLSSLSDVTKFFVDMYVDTDAAEPVFYLLYDDGRTTRFTYDETVPAVPDTTVQIYSLYDDNNIRMAISAYQAIHPEIYLKYEVGLEQGTGQTEEDALKNLATGLAGGNGPDILLMDGLPFDSYMEKGVLADISSVLGELGEDALWNNVVDDFGQGEAVYAAPMVFNIPVFSGDSEKLGQIKSLSDLADVLEREETAEGKSLLGLLRPEDIIYIMGLANGNQWVQNGTLNKEALTDFLTQCKRIYAANTKGLSPEEIEEQILEVESSVFASDDKMYGTKMNQKYNAESQFLNETGTKGVPYSAGVFGGDTYMSLNGYLAWLNSFDKDYALIPGETNTCIAQSVLAINSGAKEMEAAKDFLVYALSEEFQAENTLSGISVNKEAFYKQQINPVVDENGNPSREPYAAVGVVDENGIGFDVDYVWASEEELAKYNHLIESIESVNRCDDRVFDEVITEGAYAVAGTKEIEEAVDAIEEKVQLYLAE